MWFGILTPGEHECRERVAPGIATLYCWNDIARMRVDGPVDDIATGMRMLRDTMRSRRQEAHDPRCFGCGCPYDFPDPEVARASAVDWEPDPQERCTSSVENDAGFPRPAIFALVHIQDDEERDEEALVVVPSVRLATLVPLDAVDRLLDIIAFGLAHAEPERCSACDAVAPAGALNGPGHAVRRTVDRHSRRGARGRGRHRRAA